MAGYCALSHVSTVVIYCGAFQRAYRLQEFQQKMKRELRVACRGISSRAGYIVRKEVGKAVNALSCPGLKVGGFHEMERESAMIFIDFVESQLISLLVGF